NLLNLQTDPYRSENITLHEFSHTVASAIRATQRANRTENPFWTRLTAAFDNAAAKHLYDNTYAATDSQEYWAEGAQAWFDCARTSDRSVHAGIWNRDQQKQYDPQIAALLKEVYGDGSWRYVKSTNQPVVVDAVTFIRSPDDLSHLLGLNRTTLPAFNFNNSPRILATRPGASRPVTVPSTTATSPTSTSVQNQ
ncbi:MAG TPA: hypothetical protein VGN88_10500, partial [Phycisphaerae bacterium]